VKTTPKHPLAGTNKTELLKKENNELNQTVLGKQQVAKKKAAIKPYWTTANIQRVSKAIMWNQTRLISASNEL